jgi:hypothetical protein
VRALGCVEKVSRSGKPYTTNDAGKLRRGKKSSAAGAHTPTHTHEIHARQKEKKKKTPNEEKEQGGHRRDDVGEVRNMRAGGAGEREREY